MPKRRYSFFMPTEDHLFIKRFVVRSRMWLTDYGKILASVLFVSAMVSSPGLMISAYLLSAFILTLFIVTFVFAFFSKPRVKIVRVMAPAPCAGEHYFYQAIVTNIGKRPIRNIKISEDFLPYGLYDAPQHKNYSAQICWLDPGESVTISLVIRCKLRGIYELKRLLVGTNFPSGLCRWPVRIKVSDKLVVYPEFLSQTQFLVPFKRVYQPGGIAVSSHVGDSTEFLSTRDYRKGDRLRDIHWGSFARTGRLIVKEYVDEYFVRVGILLDTQLRRKEPEKSFEERISLAAGIAEAIAHKDYIIDLFAAGDILHHFQMGRSLAHLENLLELLACIENVRTIDFNKLKDGLTPFVPKLSSIIVLLGDWDEPRAQLCRALEELGASIRVVVVSERPTTMPPDRELTLITGKEKKEIIK